MQPRVNGLRSQNAGKRYKLGRPYDAQQKSTNSNYESWQVILAMFALAPVHDYGDLCVACRHHRHGDGSKHGPEPWIDYLIKNGWLVEA